MKKLDYIARSATEAEIRDFLQTPSRSGFTYLRGRRRVGKSTMLRKIAKEGQHFYFMGARDERTASTLRRFARTWEQFTGKRTLSELHSKSLDWERCFDEIDLYAQQNPSRDLGIIFDEVQWLAKGQNGFVGLLKQAWLDWEKLKNLKIIVCGSSNKFFADHVGGEETVLRGIRTRSDIWVEPFSLGTVAKYFLPNWSWEQVCCTYMLLGGIPFYLNQIDAELNFIRGMSLAICNKQSIFFDEVDEMLGLEFNYRGLKTIKKILAALGQTGKTQSQIIKASDLSETTVLDAIHKLTHYQILSEKINLAHSPAQRLNNPRLFMKDFYLNFFFQVLAKKSIELKQSPNPLAFAELFGSTGSYYIPNFSGKAFELLVQYELERSLNTETSLAKLLKLEKSPFQVCHYQTPKAEHDLVLLHEKERVLRIFECKWTNTPELISRGITQLAESPLSAFPGFAVIKYLVTNSKVLKEQLNLANKIGVNIVSCEELL